MWLSMHSHYTVLEVFFYLMLVITALKPVLHHSWQGPKLTTAKPQMRVDFPLVSKFQVRLCATLVGKY